MLKNIELKKKIDLLKKQGKKIVLCHGVFDLIHVGHIYHFKKAKSYGDYLIVSITSEKFIKKGPGRPLFNDIQRFEFLKSIKFIDQVLISNGASAEDIIKTIKPNVYVKGPDYRSNKDDKTKKILLENRLVKKFKGKIKYTDDLTFSSSKIINEENFILNSEQKNFINNIKKKYSYQEIFNILNKFKKLKVLILGELIIDKYTFGDVVGKSSKEPHLVLNQRDKEYYIGGSGAIARHLNSFVKQIDLICPLGNEKFYEKLIEKNFTKNITKHFLRDKKFNDTIVKERFIDKVSGYKLFGSYIIPDSKSLLIEKQIIKKVEHLKNKADLIIVTDYGHHFLTDKIAKNIINSKTFVAVNAQVNSSTQGYNSIEKYIGVNAIIINEAELRQETRDSISDIKYLSKKYKKDKKLSYLIVTMGKNGVILVNNLSKIFYCPAFAKKTVDKVGSGDAMLSIISLCLKLKLDPYLILFLGSLAASSSVESMGNKKNINFEDLDRSIEYMMK
jgi:rfaE bifunctional protein kinase chain/domain/rfaE bifunctional protein nucleotidyltransferase chain/domain